MIYLVDTLLVRPKSLILQDNYFQKQLKITESCQYTFMMIIWKGNDIVFENVIRVLFNNLGVGEHHGRTFDHLLKKNHDDTNFILVRRYL